MTQNNLRKEPTFGQPSQSLSPETSAITDSAEKITLKQPATVSMHSNQSPGHTFTPLVKRPEAEQAAISAAAKDALAKANTDKTAQPNQATSANNAKVAPNLGFAFTPVEKDTAENNQKPLTAEPISAQKVHTEQTKMEQNLTQTTEKESSNLERVIPAQTATTQKKASITEKVPSKYRRLLLVALLLLALLLIFFLLKPNTPQSVEDLQAQGSSLPIEFRPVDEEEAKRAEEEARALQQQLEAERQVQVTTETTQATETVSTESATVDTAINNEMVTTELTTPTIAPVVTKPNTTASVIHQPEAAKTEVVKAEPTKTKTLKPATAPAKQEPTKAKAETNKATVATAKAKNETAAAKPSQPVTNTATSNAVSAKTITVQKGVSLFQNFRDNGLEANLPELNKMTKLNGATSRLNPGQKITVRLDKNNRIVEMNIGNGKYIRQADGNYIYR